jgi:hypothetical protein
MRRLRLIPAIMLAAAGCPVAAAKTPLFRTGSEHAAPGEVRAAQPLLRFVLGALESDDVRMLDECIVEQGLTPRDYGTLLRAVSIRAGPGRRLWFVRPALTPWCRALYGAHLFRYFLVEERLGSLPRRYRLVFRGVGDFFAVYPRLSHGLNDIEPTGCAAFECRTSRMAFDGAVYRPTRCTRTTWRRNGEEVTRPIRCR